MARRILVFVIAYGFIGVLYGAIEAYKYASTKNENEADDTSAFIALSLIAWPGIICVSVVKHLARIVRYGKKEENDEFKTDKERGS